MSQNSANTYRYPRRINDPVLIFAWPSNQVLPALGMLGATILIGHFLIMLGLAIGWWILYGILNERFAPGYILHFLWWHGMTTSLTDECSVVPDPLKREFHS